MRISVCKEENQDSVRKEKRTLSLAKHVRAASHNVDCGSTKAIHNIEHRTRKISGEAKEIEKRHINLNIPDYTQLLPTT